MMAKEVVGVKFCTLFEDRNKNDYFLNPINTKVISSPPFFFLHYCINPLPLPGKLLFTLQVSVEKCHFFQKASLTAPGLDEFPNIF